MDTELSSSSPAPIDAVITWVDGGDIKHAEKLDRYLQSIGGGRPQSASATRFHDSGEIDYCIVSILKFAPWVRTIFIVTDNQQPNLLARLKGTAFESRVKVVDHKEIFSGFEQYLPTFNSSSILTVLWRIPGLAEKFIFFNDDFALVRPVFPIDFFRGDKVVLRGHWHLLSRFMPHVMLKNILIKLKLFKMNSQKQRVGYRPGQQVAARLMGFSFRYFRLPHTPHAWRVSTQKKYYDEHPGILEENLRHKLRSVSQYIVEAFSAHLELKNQSAVIDNGRTNIQLKPSGQPYWRIKLKLAMADRNENAIFVCVQSIEAASPKKQKLILSWLDKRIGCLGDLRNEKLKK